MWSHTSPSPSPSTSSGTSKPSKPSKPSETSKPSKTKTKNATSNAAFSCRNTSTSTTTSSVAYDETSCLLFHERAPLPLYLGDWEDDVRGVWVSVGERGDWCYDGEGREYGLDQGLGQGQIQGQNQSQIQGQNSGQGRYQQQNQQQSSPHTTQPRQDYHQGQGEHQDQDQNQNQDQNHHQHHHNTHLSTTSSTASQSLHRLLTLHPRQIALLEHQRALDERTTTSSSTNQGKEAQGQMQRSMLSRIDHIEVDLWHERIRDWEAAELGMVSARELVDVDGCEEDLDEQRGGRRECSGGDGEEGDGERLSRVNTHVNSSSSITDFAALEEGRKRRRKAQGRGSRGSRTTSSITGLPSTSLPLSLSLNHPHNPFFYHDILGISSLVLLLVCLLLFITIQLRSLDINNTDQICGRHAGGLWIAVHMLVALGVGLILQVPVGRGVVPFVLPVWVVGTVGVVGGLRGWVGCFGE